MKRRSVFINTKTVRRLMLLALLIVLLPLGGSTAATNPTLDVYLDYELGTCNDSYYRIDFGWLFENDDQGGFDDVGIIAYDANGTRIAADWNGRIAGQTFLMTALFGGVYGMNPMTARPIYIEMYDLTSHPPLGFNTDEVYDAILDQVSNGAPLMLSMAYDPAVDMPDCANLPDLAPLVASATCVGEDLEVAITNGIGPFDITSSTGSAPNVPATVLSGTTIVEGPGKWDDLTISETLGIDVMNLGNFKCRPLERPVPLTPVNRSRTTDTTPTFTWTSITDANNYRVFVFDDKAFANRIVDIRQNSGGPTTLTINTQLPTMRLFWRVRGRVNNIWSLWSERFTLFIDPPAVRLHSESQATPIPTIDLAPPNQRATVELPPPTVVPTIAPSEVTPEPSIAPPNSR